MNFLPATVEGDTVELPFGKVEIPADKAEQAAGKGLLIAGIRPEAFEDASVVDQVGQRARRSRATVDVVEWLGNEAYAYIPFEAPPEVREQLDQLERELDGEALRTQLVISLDGGQPDHRGRRGRDLGRHLEDAPLRPGHRREPHRGPRERRRDPQGCDWPGLA